MQDLSIKNAYFITYFYQGVKNEKNNTFVDCISNAFWCC